MQKNKKKRKKREKSWNGECSVAYELTTVRPSELEELHRCRHTDLPSQPQNKHTNNDISLLLHLMLICVLSCCYMLYGSNHSCFFVGRI